MGKGDGQVQQGWLSTTLREQWMDGEMFLEHGQQADSSGQWAASRKQVGWRSDQGLDGLPA